jgi:hypothetical protein
MPGADVHDSSNGVSIDKYPVHVNVIPGIRDSWNICLYARLRRK